MSSLEKGFKEEGIAGKGELLERLLGSPTLIASLTGIEKEIAINGYVAALAALFTFGGILALVALALQAGTGWSAPPGMVEAQTALRRINTMGTHDDTCDIRDTIRPNQFESRVSPLGLLGPSIPASPVQ
jgi:hypothetical protein